MRAETDAGAGETPDYDARALELGREAATAREAFDPPAELPAEERALSYLRRGAGPVVALYVEARTGGEQVAFDPEAWDALERALNDWLALYARCYGVEMDPGFTVREAAELLVRTHDIADVAQLLTCVPER
ncbi:MAG: hypothetical protein ABEJ82_05720 [Haloplanus sp.]